MLTSASVRRDGRGGAAGGPRTRGWRAASGSALRCGLGRAQHQIWLAATDQLQIHLGEDFAELEKRAVQRPRGVVDAEAPAQRIQRVLGTGNFFARQRQRIQRPRPRKLGLADHLQLGIEEFHVEGGAMDDQFGIVADEAGKFGRHIREKRFVAQELVGQAVDGDGFGGDLTLRVQVFVEGPAGGQVVHQLDRADFDDAAASGRVKAGGFGVEDDLTHLVVPEFRHI